MYSIELSKKAKQFIKKIHQKDREAILKKIYSIREEPFRYLKKLQGSKLWRLRIMKYRAIIDVVISNNRIVVLRIGLRKRVY
tara:strand:+ start:26 stop:271 length:246 start_codon:yes stop_codon:yes gene_type:complete